jgi:hypothetical protein
VKLAGKTALASGLAAHIALVVASVLVSLVVLEVACRLIRAGPEALAHWPNLARGQMIETGDGEGCSYADDAMLGWALPRHCRSATYNVTDGLREKPSAEPPAGPPVLVTGSSFAMGDEVSDNETWPAFLQGLIGRHVVNAGVSGYALDQTALRTEEIAPRLRPVAIIVSFTAGDIWRNEQSVAYSREKPYFALVDGHLELRNVPVASPARKPPPLPLAARLFGRSMLAREIVERLAIRDGWYYDEVQATVPGSGPAISCLLMQRLARLGMPVVVLAQYGRGVWIADGTYKADALHDIATVLGCASEAGLIPFDLAEPLKAAVEARGLDAIFRSEHHTPEGNRVVAELILQELVRRHLLPSTGDASLSSDADSLPSSRAPPPVRRSP